ncbi:hypothetical protein SAMN05421665_3191 [Yoonia rosea]|uniref:Uncharacterized protein n=1 Tax=Yoonia rosea TaxID=287098 RepID=A0A1R3XH83_9RHOB|nr:hypothetical protein [Yoonia rosea]SIT90691.1 hypothetical protein SAMN05421665_3191 [Yoonia rosea]
MSDAVTLFGTDQPPVEGQHYAVGPWSFTLEDGALRHIALQGHEAIRNIAFLVRDRDWGTLVPALDNLQVSQTDTTLGISYDAVFNSNDSKLSVRVSIDVSPESLVMSATGHALGSFETNRAGFTVLHPIADVAGQPVRVKHSDGSSEDSAFPDLIHPWRPFMDIAALTNQVGSAELCCAFHGDTFEMEDQRQWGDASFKTYNRPLDLPWPYIIVDGTRLSQSVELTWAPYAISPALPVKTGEIGAIFPEMALVISAQDALRLADKPSDVTFVNPQRLLCHFDAELGDTTAQFEAFAAAQHACPDQVFDLELICLFNADPATELNMLAAQMRDAGFAPDSILVCPSVDRQSTPPGSEWPDCPPLAAIHNAASRAFPDVTRGGGMVSLFPELNRKRPPLETLDFVSHGLCPIVHAADDISVMETLAAIPHITRSARAIFGDMEYRIGPATIAMRQNPYGTRTIPNPDNERICMAHDDPRHRGTFGAAYVIGLACALAPAGLSVWTPAALYGPRGVIADDGQWPISTALKGLAECAGLKVHSAQVAHGRAEARIGNLDLKANLTAKAQQTLAPYAWSITAANAPETT